MFSLLQAPFIYKLASQALHHGAKLSIYQKYSSYDMELKSFHSSKCLLYWNIGM